MSSQRDIFLTRLFERAKEDKEYLSDLRRHGCRIIGQMAPGNT